MTGPSIDPVTGICDRCIALSKGGPRPEHRFRVGADGIRHLALCVKGGYYPVHADCGAELAPLADNGKPKTENRLSEETPWPTTG